MKVYVICANDSIKGAVINDEQGAKRKMRELSNQDYKSYHFSFDSREDYDHCVFWHIHEPEIL